METTFKKCILAAAVLLGLWFGIRFLLPLLLPFALGLGLALLAEPVTRLLSTRLRLPRALAAGISVTTVFCFLALLVLLVCALILRELGKLSGVLPDLGQTAQAGMDVLRRWLLGITHQLPGGMGSILRRNISGIFSNGSALLDRAVKYLLALAGNILAAMPDGAMALGTAVIASFMISAKLPQLRAGIRARMSQQRLAALAESLKRIRRAIGGWLLAQAKLSGVTFAILWLGFWFLGISYAPLWAALTALVDAFPVLGTGTVLVPWSIITFLQSNTPRGLGLISLYAIVMLVRSVLEPKLVGKQLGLDPLLTLAALYCGYKLFGLGGMILAPMLTVVIKQSVPLWNQPPASDP